MRTMEAIVGKLKYFFSEGAKGLKNNKTMSLASIATIFLSLLLIGVFVLMNEIVNNVTESVEEQVAVTAYISDDATEEQIATAQAELEKLDGVASISFTSKDQAMEDFKASLGSEDDITAQLESGTNPLPASFKLELEDPQQVESVASAILNVEAYTTICDNTEDPTDSVKYGQQTVDRLFSFTTIVKTGGTILVLILVFIAFVFMNNTIRLAVLSRRKELSIQRLVGASNSFIRGPFLAEGIIHAVIGALLAIICLELIHQLVIPMVGSSLTWLPLDLGVAPYIILYISILIIAILIGVISSAMAMKKYLKV